MMTSIALNHDKTVLPPPPQYSNEADDVHIYERFMRYFRHVPTSRADIRVLSAIQFTADILNHSDAHVAKVLVEFGLRAPRMAFPADFLKFADQSYMRGGWDVGAPSRAMIELKMYWDAIGEDKFAAFKGQYDLMQSRAFV